MRLASRPELRQFAAEARSLNAADLSRMTETKRHRDVAAYAVQAGVSADPTTFVAELKAKFAEVANEVDRAFPDNEHVEIVGGRPVIGRLRAKAAPMARIVLSGS